MTVPYTFQTKFQFIFVKKKKIQHIQPWTIATEIECGNDKETEYNYSKHSLHYVELVK